MKQLVLTLSIICISVAVFGQGYRSGPASNTAGDVSGVVGSPHKPIGTQLTPTAGSLTGYGQYGNAVVTGNVASGRHFRGDVPYGSVGEFDSTIIDSGSRQVSSFIRRSAGRLYSGDTYAETGSYYYDQRRAVGSVQRGPQSLVYGRLPSRFGVSERTIQLDSQQEDLRFSADSFSMSSSGAERMGVERMIAEQIGHRNAAIRYDISLRQQGQLQEGQNVDDDKLNMQRVDGGMDQLLKPVMPDTPVVPSELGDSRKSQIERAERELMSALLEDEEAITARSYEMTARSDDSIGDMDELDGRGRQDKLRNLETGSERTGAGSQTVGAGVETAVAGTGVDMGVGVSSASRIGNEDAAGWQNRAKVILGTHENFESLAAEKVAGYKTQAVKYMKQGRFYKADDNYRLALVWDSQDAAAMFGRVMALFGAGSYLSGSFCAWDVLVLSPEYALAQKNPAEILGGRDILEDRMIELKDWQKKSSSERLAFLMAYIFYIDGKIEDAGAALESASVIMSDDPAYGILKRSVEAGN